jgi:hypothetical protein
MPSYVEWQGRSFASTLAADKAKQALDWHPVEDRATLVEVGIHGPADEFIK